MKTVKDWLDETDPGEIMKAYRAPDSLSPYSTWYGKVWMSKAIRKALDTKAGPISDYVFVATPVSHGSLFECVTKMHKKSDLLAHQPGDAVNSYCWGLLPLASVLSTEIADTPYMRRNAGHVLAFILNGAGEFSDCDEDKELLLRAMRKTVKEYVPEEDDGEEPDGTIEDDTKETSLAAIDRILENASAEDIVFTERPTFDYSNIDTEYPGFTNEEYVTYDDLWAQIMSAVQQLDEFCWEKEIVEVKKILAD